MPRRGVDLSEEQWRIVKSHAAKRGQTISAFFGDVVMEMGLGRATGKDYPPARSTGKQGNHAVFIDPTTGTVVDPVTDMRTTSTTNAAGATVSAAKVNITNPDPTAMERSLDDEDFIRPVSTFGSSRPAPKPAKKK